MGIYALLSDVKEILLSTPGLKAGGKRVDFSEDFRDMRPNPNNGGDVALSRVDFDDSYFGVANFKIAFTSSIAFDATMEPEGNKVEVKIGSGDVNTVFTATNPMLTPVANVYVIDPSYWTGTAQAADSVIFRSTSSISNNAAERLIEKASYFIDGLILASNLATNADLQNLMFTSLTIPKSISLAAEYLSAYFIWVNVHRSSDPQKSMAQSWKDMAVAYTSNYIKQLPRPGPVWSARKPIVATSENDSIRATAFEGATSDQASIGATIEEVAKRLRSYEDSVDYSALVFP